MFNTVNGLEKRDGGTHTSCSQEAHGWDFFDGQVDKNPPADAGNTGLILGPGTSYMPWGNQPMPTTAEPVF